MDGPFDGVNNVAQTVLGTDIVVLLAAVVLVMALGLAAILWYFGRAFSKQSDASIEQIKLFNSTLRDVGGMNIQLQSANNKNVEVLDRIGDQIVTISETLRSQQAFCNETLALLQSHTAISQEEHAQIAGKVDQMNGGVLEEIRGLKAQISAVEAQIAELRKEKGASETALETQYQALTVQLAALNTKVATLLERLASGEQ